LQIGLAPESENLDRRARYRHKNNHAQFKCACAPKVSSRDGSFCLPRQICTVTFSCAAFAAALVERLCQVIATLLPRRSHAAAPSMAGVAETGMDRALYSGRHPEIRFGTPMQPGRLDGKLVPSFHFVVAQAL